jgi:hypothetical protein
VQVVALLLEECKPAIDKAIFATGFIQRAPAATERRSPHRCAAASLQPLRWNE